MYSVPVKPPPARKGLPRSEPWIFNPLGKYLNPLSASSDSSIGIRAPKISPGRNTTRVFYSLPRSPPVENWLGYPFPQSDLDGSYRALRLFRAQMPPTLFPRLCPTSLAPIPIAAFQRRRIIHTHPPPSPTIRSFRYPCFLFFRVQSRELFITADL